MKRYLPLAALSLLMMLRCSGTGTGDTDTGFTYQPGTMTALTVNNKEILSNYYNCTPAATNCYAIISTNTVNSVSYVGISFTADPSVKTSFAMRIRFVASAIPSSIVLDSNNADHMIKLRPSGLLDFTAWDNNGATITLNFTNIGDGTYTITSVITGSILFGGANALTSLTLRAQKYP